MMIDDISMAVISLIRVGAAFRFVYCMVRLQGAEEEQAQYRKRAKKYGAVLCHCRKHLADQGYCDVLLWVIRRREPVRKGGTTEEQKWELYIPSGVKAENELFNGFGRRELLQSAAGSLFGSAVAAVIWLCSGNVAFTVVAALTGIFGSVMMCTKDQNNQSVVDQVGNMVRFARNQQIYPYRALSEWGTW